MSIRSRRCTPLRRAAFALRDGRAARRRDGRRFPARGHLRLRSRAAGRARAARLRNAVARLALGRPYSAARERRGGRQAARPSASAFEDALGLAGTQSGRLDGRAVRGDVQAHAPRLRRARRTGMRRRSRTAAIPASSACSNANTAASCRRSAKGTHPMRNRCAADLATGGETESYIIKPYAAMGALLAPIGAMLELRERWRFRPTTSKRSSSIARAAAFHHGGCGPSGRSRQSARK